MFVGYSWFVRFLFQGFFSLLKCLKPKRVSSYFAFPGTLLGLTYISFLAARLSGTCLLMSACCNSVNKNNLQFSGRTIIYKQSVRDLALARFLKHVIIPQKWQVFHYKYSKTPHWRFQKKAKSELGQTVRLTTQWPEVILIGWYRIMLCGGGRLQ